MKLRPGQCLISPPSHRGRCDGYGGEMLVPEMLYAHLQGWQVGEGAEWGVRRWTEGCTVWAIESWTKGWSFE